jgi:hypothetical protein
MKLITTIISYVILTVSVCADELCPVCQSILVDVTTQVDDKSKPSKNLSVWNRSICANPFFHKGSLICPRDGYAYEAQLKQWKLSLESRDSFAYPLDRKIYEFPLPVSKAIKSRTVYSQIFEKLDSIEHGLLFWTLLDDSYFTEIRKYAKTNGIVLAIDPHRDQGQAVIKVSLTTETEQAAPSNR